MDKDNSQEPMITSNSPSLEKGREKVLCRHRLYHFRFLRRGNQPVIVKEKLRAGNG